MVSEQLSLQFLIQKGKNLWERGRATAFKLTTWIYLLNVTTNFNIRAVINMVGKDMEKISVRHPRFQSSLSPKSS